MAKKAIKKPRISLTLTPELDTQMNNYILAVGKEQGRIPAAIKTKICRMALNEWFARHGKEHGKDFDKLE